MSSPQSLKEYGPPKLNTDSSQTGKPQCLNSQLEEMIIVNDPISMDNKEAELMYEAVGCAARANNGNSPVNCDTEAIVRDNNDSQDHVEGVGDTCVPTQDDGWLVYKVLNIHIFDAKAAVEDKEPCVSSVHEQMNANSLTIKKNASRRRKGLSAITTI